MVSVFFLLDRLHRGVGAAAAGLGDLNCEWKKYQRLNGRGPARYIYICMGVCVCVRARLLESGLRGLKKQVE